MEITKNYLPAELEEFKNLVLTQWLNVEFSKDCEGESNIPKPILARKNNSIIGGLSYIWYPKPNHSELVLWVNTVLVVPSYRKQGVGTALVKCAMQEQSPETELYVYSSIPGLYLKLGWSLVSSDNENYVLKYVHKSL